MKPKLMFVLVAALTVLLSHDAQAFYNTSTGRWLSRDPIEEQGGANVYRFASNDGINGADFMGFVVICKCPQAYFTSLGLKEGMHYQSAGPDTYTAIRGASFCFGELEKQTVWKMLESKRSFKAKNLSVEQLKRHVAARIAVTRAIWQVRWPLIADGRSLACGSSSTQTSRFTLRQP